MATSLASAARPFWRLLEYCHIDAARVFREAGLDPTLMDKPRERYPVERRTAAWVRAVALTDDPCFGLKMAEVVRPTDLHALGYAVLASSTLRTALERLARFVPVINDGIAFGIEEGDGRAVFALSAHAYPSLLAAQKDSLWSWIVGFCRLAAGPHFDAAEVFLRHPELSCTGDYFGFFRCPVRFSADISAVVFSSADLDRPLPAADRELARANDRILADFLAKLQKDDLVTRVKVAIAEALPSGAPADETIARTLCLSQRTLHRRLAAQGTGYSKLLDAVRRELAERYIADPTVSLYEIGALLGFSEQSAFSRAFRRWTGRPPSAVRDQAA